MAASTFDPPPLGLHASKKPGLNRVNLSYCTEYNIIMNFTIDFYYNCESFLD